MRKVKRTGKNIEANSLVMGSFSFPSGLIKFDCSIYQLFQ